MRKPLVKTREFLRRRLKRHGTRIGEERRKGNETRTTEGHFIYSAKNQRTNAGEAEVITGPERRTGKERREKVTVRNFWKKLFSDRET